MKIHGGGSIELAVDFYGHVLKLEMQWAELYLGMATSIQYTFCKKCVQSGGKIANVYNVVKEC
jgi:hypothetical protein